MRQLRAHAITRPQFDRIPEDVAGGAGRDRVATREHLRRSDACQVPLQRGEHTATALDRLSRGAIRASGKLGESLPRARESRVRREALDAPLEAEQTGALGRGPMPERLQECVAERRKTVASRLDQRFHRSSQQRMARQRALMLPQQCEASLGRATGARSPMGQLVEQSPPVRKEEHHTACGRRSTMGHEFDHLDVGLVPDRCHERCAAMEGRFRHHPFVEGPEILATATATRDEDRVDPQRARHRIDATDGPCNLDRRTFALDWHIDDHDADRRAACGGGGETVAQRRAGTTGDDGDPARQHRQRRLAFLVEPSLGAQLVAKGAKSLFQGTETARLDALHDELGAAGARPEFEGTGRPHLVTLCQLGCPRRAALPHHALDDTRLILESEEPVGLPGEAAHLPHDAQRSTHMVGNGGRHERRGIADGEIAHGVARRGPFVDRIGRRCIDRRRAAGGRHSRIGKEPAEGESRIEGALRHDPYSTSRRMSTGAIMLNGALSELPGIGPRSAERLATLGLRTNADLIRHLPLRYEHERPERTIAESELLIPMRPGAEALLSVRGEIAVSRVIRRAKPRVEATLEDGSGSIRLLWFNAPWMDTRLRPGTRGVAQGKALRRNGYLEMVNPSWEIIAAGAEPPPRSERLRPIYPAGESIPSSKIEQLVEQVLEACVAQIEDPLPEPFRRSRDLPPLGWAWRAMHRPEDMDEVAAARRRLAFDELFVLQLGVMMRRSQLRRAGRAATLPLTRTIDERIRARLPHRLTEDQELVVAEIVADLARGVPMNRLLQGDVGSGKTLVALFAMLLAVAHGHQAALVVPTEILAEQHFRSLTTMLAMSQVEVELLSAGRGAAKRSEVLAGLADGRIGIVVGTHALLESAVRFRSLALAVIDEQHRFGVHQRAAVRDRSEAIVPHVLVMTATPIPRTMGMTLYGDLDVSTMRGRPPGRRPVTTRSVSGTKAPEVYAYARTRLDRGEQAYIVVPAVDESDAGLKDVHGHLAYLREGPFHGLEIGMVHGRMGFDERDQVMSQFRRGALAALVATVVIEVGVDVPNATMMIVEHADRFGLAQLHQLRGRVGRGEKASLCVFIADPTTPEATERLSSIAAIDDGFEIAEIDLRLRGPGELFGSRQSGLAPFRVADLARDDDLLRLARRDAQEWIERDPDLRAPELRLLRRKLMATCGQALGLADVG